LLIPGAAALAQDIGGRVEGVVRSQDGAPVVGAAVSIQGPALLATRSTVTGSDGRFVLTALPVGRYTVQVAHPESQPASFEGVVVQLGRTTALPPLTLVPGDMHREEVQVTAGQSLIEPASTRSGGNLDWKYFSNVPIDRSYQSIATLLPTVDASYLGDGTNFAGATGIENRYFVDGVDVTDPYRGVSSLTLPSDFVQDVQVNVGGYEAEYRSALGGLTNVITPSGGNQFEGSVFGYYTADWLAQDPTLGPTEPDARDQARYDVGLSVGGPIVRDHLRYFAAYNPVFARKQVEISGLGYLPDESTTHSFAANLEWQVNAANRVVFTGLGDPQDADAVLYDATTQAASADPLLWRIESGTTSASVRGTHVLGPSVLLQTWLSRNRVADEQRPATAAGESPSFIDENMVLSGGTGGFVDNQSTVFTAGAKAGWSVGRHLLEGGFEYRDNTLDIHREGGFLQRYGDGTYVEFAVLFAGTVHSREPSLFVQDSWSPSPRWSVNFGLRWDGQTIIGSDGQVAQEIEDQYQPRLGFVYEPGAPGSQRVFGSAGRYYEQISTSLSTWYHLDGGGFRVCQYDHDPRVDPSGCQGYEVLNSIHPEVPGLRGQYFDEYRLGYERRLGGLSRLGAQLVYRTLGEAIEDALDMDRDAVTYGNPGRGALEEYPRPHRVFEALVLSLQGQAGARGGYLVSYVLSRNSGNYSGLAFTDYSLGLEPNATGAFDTPEGLEDADGLLPNDRTHVFKASGYYRLDFGLVLGATMIWESGTPLSEFGGNPWGPPTQAFIGQRGTAGRTPSVFDLNLRFQYDFRLSAGSSRRARMIADVYHLVSDGTPVAYDQIRYFALDDAGQQADPNPNYGRVTTYSPPAAVRLGFEVDF
jgi:hypothetical protein